MIRRVTNSTNVKLFDKLGVRTNITDPQVFLITNTHGSEKKFEIFENFVKKMKKTKVYNDGSALHIYF